ncbi:MULTISPECIES: YbfB/YjiJ family MFS transporter [Rhodopseudomonas]|uniref:MFS transporter n=1 Tax=Rhodopseudomonas palustris TaxID=1076 RepID=A0A0D7E767_RHOPL|nr:MULTISPECIES: YbfB/YjiJ family MFS transporter [Rhodopseudomonas]KIZ35372.1 MFS transporter [Rhodopseudomonas palustris]MDF3811665.1 YbfB/YjiJ family MFS transporter [Rhodopseudomonas sp. BAL398]WOK16330.1 YbfB/YjiJ family MFS transporter [Rhodopseudomonas sp. BAL398]
MTLIDRIAAPNNPVRLILTLSLAPTVGLGIGRFAYSLVLPDMRDALGWSYSAAGFMNTINAAGYLAGALVTSRLAARFGLSVLVRAGTLACVLSLALCALSGNFVLLSFARLLVGVGAALAFVAGAALATAIAQSHPARSAFLLSLFYAGPGIGILTSGLIAPFLLQGFGPGSWWIVWLVLTLVSAALTVPLLTTPIETESGMSTTSPARFAIAPVAIYLTAYFLFGAGYIAYMTFMIAYVRDAGGGAVAQSAFWCLIGASAFVTPWVWRRVMARDQGGVSTAIILGCLALGAAMPLLGMSVGLLAVSALVFGVSFFAVVASTTAFVRFNYPQAAWPGAIAAMTIVFGVGQTLGPIAVGAITDAMGSLNYALNVSAATLALGAVAAAFQKPLREEARVAPSS